MPRTLGRSLLLTCSAVLFGISTASAQLQPRLTLQLTNGISRLSVTGQLGSPITVQFSTNLLTGPWVAVSNVSLLANPASLLEPSGFATNKQRFYRTAIIAPSNMLWIPPGTFVMGSPVSEAARGPNNETQHSVTHTKGFYMSKYLVTQAAYRSLMNTNPSYFNTNNGFVLDLTRPVEQVTWSNATNYCGLLTQQDRVAGRIFSTWFYRLPTESEWEYACRAGTTTVFYYGNSLSNGMANFNGSYGYAGGIGTVANTNATYPNRPVAVGAYQPNAWGLSDMTGNVWEWCQDWYASFTAGSISDPPGPATGTQRVFRGGAFNATGAACRAANRGKIEPTSGFNTLGFRVVLTAGP